MSWGHDGMLCCLTSHADYTLYNEQSTARVLIGLGEVVLKVQK